MCGTGEGFLGVYIRIAMVLILLGGWRVPRQEVGKARRVESKGQRGKDLANQEVAQLGLGVQAIE